MKKIGAIVFFTTIIILMCTFSNYAFTGPQRDQSSTRQAKTEVAQLRILDDPKIDNRIADLQRKIDIWYQRGQLTPDEVNRLQTQLNGVKERVAKYRRDGFLTGDERTKIDQMLTIMEERVREERSDDETVRRDAFNRRADELQKRIDAGVRAGQLTQDEAQHLQAALSRIKARDTRYRADGLLTNEEKTVLNQMLSSLDERIRYERNDTDVVHREAFERRISEMKRRIETGMRAGQLNLDETCRLNAILIRVKDRDAQYRSDGVLTRGERIRLNEMLAHLEERIYDERWDADINNPIFR
jgi:hypothetical protein